MKFMLVPVLLLSSVAFSQTTVTVKPSAAVDALNHAAQDLAVKQKSADSILKKAKDDLDAAQKSLQAQLQKENTDLLNDLKADPKYKARMAKIDDLQKGLQTMGQDAEKKYQDQAGPIQNDITKDKATIDSLTPVVRTENNLPASATFDPVTQKWTK